MASPLHNYLRMYRKRAGLSQAEIAYLLGTKSAAKISRYEHGHRQPSFRTLVAYEVVLQVVVQELFTGEFQHIASVTRQRALVLAKKLSTKAATARTQRKIQRLQEIAQVNQRK